MLGLTAEEAHSDLVYVAVASTSPALSAASCGSDDGPFRGLRAGESPLIVPPVLADAENRPVDEFRGRQRLCLHQTSSTPEGNNSGGVEMDDAKEVGTAAPEDEDGGED